MANDVKRIRKVARCICTILEAEGVKTTATKIMDFIKDKDLSDINALKVEVANDMRTPNVQPKAAPESTRKQRIETFIVSNWAMIKDNDEIKEALFNAYCQGRYNKDQRAQMRSTLLSRCEPNQPQAEPVQTQPEPVENVSAEEMADDATTELAGALLGGDSAKYDF